MKFIEPDFARAANLLYSWYDNNVDEYLTKQDFLQFEHFVWDFLCRMAYRKGSVKYNQTNNKIIVKLLGYEEDEVNIISYTPGCFDFDVKLVDDDAKKKNEFNYIFKKFLESLKVCFSIDEFGELHFSLINKNNK